MKIYHGFEDRALKPAKRSIAIGVFDGVHRGHQKILQTMIRDSRNHSTSSMVMTFDPHPAKILAPKKFHPTILMSLEHRLSVFKWLGIKEAMIIPFSKRFAAMPRESFFENILLNKLTMASLTVGHDFRFGKKALGNAEYLKSRCANSHTRLYLIDPLKAGSQIISSTHIRGLIEKGDLDKAAWMLGRPVSVFGTVVHGRARGKSLGFPTANLDPHHEALPPSAVYAAYGFLGKKKLKGVLHIGERPTFRDRQKTLEVHFLNFHQNVYGQDIELIFVKKLREVRRFGNPELLRKAIETDIATAQKLL